MLSDTRVQICKLRKMTTLELRLPVSNHFKPEWLYEFSNNVACFKIRVYFKKQFKGTHYMYIHVYKDKWYILDRHEVNILYMYNSID